MSENNFKLSHSSYFKGLSLGKADWFKVKPYAHRIGGEDHIYFATIKAKRTFDLSKEEREKYPWIDTVYRTSAALVQITSETLRNELSKFYAPGGIHIKFIEKDDGWLVTLSAESILASVYMGLSPEEGHKLLGEVLCA